MSKLLFQQNYINLIEDILIHRKRMGNYNVEINTVLTNAFQYIPTIIYNELSEFINDSDYKYSHIMPQKYLNFILISLILYYIVDVCFFEEKSHLTYSDFYYLTSKMLKEGILFEKKSFYITEFKVKEVNIEHGIRILSNIFLKTDSLRIDKAFKGIIYKFVVDQDWLSIFCGTLDMDMLKRAYELSQQQLISKASGEGGAAPAPPAPVPGEGGAAPQPIYVQPATITVPGYSSSVPGAAGYEHMPGHGAAGYGGHRGGFRVSKKTRKRKKKKKSRRRKKKIKSRKRN